VLRWLAPLVVLAGCGDDATRGGVLVFSRTTGYRHAAIPTAVATLEELGAARGFTVEATEDPAIFDDADLARFRVVVFALTSGDVVDDAQQAALERFVARGGGWVGIHSAADTEYDWPWYDDLLGTHFLSHPPGAYSTVVSADPARPAPARAIPAGGWPVVDELYNFRDDPRAVVTVLATIDERTYDGGTMGADHPIAWCHEVGGGRAWYLGLGHRPELYADPVLRGLLGDGLDWAAGDDLAPAAP